MTRGMERRPFSGRAVRRERGQVMAEYAVMLAVCVAMLLAFMLLFSAFSQYGARLIGLVSWEPNPPSASEMNKMMSGL